MCDGLHISRPASLTAIVIACVVTFVAAARCPASAIPEAENIVVVTLDREPIADGVVVVERSGQIYAPVCSVLEALSLAVTCSAGRAYGFVIEESNPFVIDLKEGYAISGRHAFGLGRAAFWKEGDVYADISQLSQWLPLDFSFEKNSSNLRIHPRKVLPLQEFRKRKKSRPAAPIQPHKDFRQLTPPTAIAAIPTIDFASQLQLTGEENTTMQGVSLNSIDLAGDLLHMSGEGHVSLENDVLKRLDISLYRRTDPAFMIGPIPVSQIRLGSSQVPYIDGIGASSKPMYGIYLSNRPIYGASNFLNHDINGSLPQGWDAELFHNGMPIGYQPPTSDNMYHFQNLRVYYGVNNFKVVLHGPFGERRESEETFISDAITPKGDLLYTVSSVWETGLTDNDSVTSTSTSLSSTSTGTTGPHKETNITVTSDYGITKYLTGASYLVRHTDLYAVERDFAAAGLRTAFRNTLLSMDLIGEYYPGNGATGGLVTVRSSSRDVIGLSLEATQRFFWNYDSPQFPQIPDPLTTKTTLKANSSFTAYALRIPYAIEIDVDSYKSGKVGETSAWRLSGGWNGWNGAVEADVSYQEEILMAAAILQISTRVNEISLRGQAGFSFSPDVYASNINVSADKDLGAGFFFNSSISHDPTNEVSEFKAGLSKKFGLIGYSFAGTATSHGAFTLTAGLRTSLGVDRANDQAIVSAEPLSPYGMIAVSAAVADPGNATEKPLPNVGFLVNGSRANTIRGSKGVPVIANLVPDIPVDVAIDLTTVEDPFMVPMEEGCRITPRAGVVSACKFTMTAGGEVDGMIFVRLGQSSDVPVKDVRVDLYTEGGSGAKLQASTRSQESGYYLFKAVKPGVYKVVIPEAEIIRLKAAPVAPIAVTMPVGGDMVSGKDFYLSSAAFGKKDGATAD